MNPYNIAKSICQDKLGIDLVNEIGNGANGRVYDLPGNKVIKISVLYDFDLSKIELDKRFATITKIYNSIVASNLACLVKIYEFGHLLSAKRDTAYGKQDFIIYYSIQEKLCELTDDEKKILKTICKWLDNELELSVRPEETINNLSQWLLFDSEKIIDFYNVAKDLPFEHRDIHRRNILKDGFGNFKLIDFDLAKEKENGKQS